MNYNKILGGKKCNEEGYYCTNKQTPLGKRGCKSNNTGKKSKICDCLPSGDTYRCRLSSKNKKSQNKESQNYKVKIIELEKENKILKHKLNESKKIIQRLLDERRIYTTPVLSKKTEEYKKQKNPEQYKQYQNTLAELKKDKEEYKQNMNKENILDKLKEEKKIKNQKIEELKKKLADVRARKR